MTTFDMNAYMRQRHAETREKALEYLGNVCSRCGSVEELEFHHPDPTTKEFTISTKLSKLSWPRLVIELDKCVLLCKACHDEEHITWRHGTLSGYRYCKCEECRKAKSEHHKAYMKKRKRLQVVGATPTGPMQV